MTKAKGKVRVDKDVQIVGDSTLAFFIMPGEALALLHDELEAVVGRNLAESVLYRYGFNCGESMSRRLNLSPRAIEDVPHVLSEIWSELGFGRISVGVEDDGIAVYIREGIEGTALGIKGTASCHFTRGYLAGVVSSIVGTRMNTIEDECMAKGDEFCRMQIASRFKI